MRNDKVMTSIDLVFENVESLSIPATKLTGLELNGLSEDWYFQPLLKKGQFDFNHQKKTVTKTTTGARIGIKAAWLKQTKTNVQKRFPEGSWDSQGLIKNAYDRLRVRDLSKINIHYEDGQQVEVCLPWVDDPNDPSDGTNLAMLTHYKKTSDEVVLFFNEDMSVLSKIATSNCQNR